MKPFSRLGQASLAAVLLILPACNKSASAERNDPSRRLGPNASLQGRELMPEDNPWNQDISREPVDPNSSRMHRQHRALIGRSHPDFGTVYDGPPIGIPYVRGHGQAAQGSGALWQCGRKRPGPLPHSTRRAHRRRAIRGRRSPCARLGHETTETLSSLFNAFRDGRRLARRTPGRCSTCASIACVPMAGPRRTRPGLPILPGLVRYDEVFGQRRSPHAMRFTVAAAAVLISTPRRTSPARTPSPTCRPWACGCASRPISTCRAILPNAA